MESFPAFIIDAFTERRFTGNPAAVCLIPRILEDKEYQKIAAEFNLSETAFPVPIGGITDFRTCSQFSLRWFTPTTEVPLCGHATLATSHVLFNEVGNISKEIKFDTKSGVLVVKRNENGSVQMNFPKYDITSLRFSHVENRLHGIFSEFKAPHFLWDLVQCVVPKEIVVTDVAYAAQAKKLIIVVDPETTKFELEGIRIDDAKLLELHDGSFVRGVAITLHPKSAIYQGFMNSSNEEFDYACRYFAPWVGIKEDPATGSAQCCLGPFWAKLLDKQQLYVLQAYPNRGAEFRVGIEDQRVILDGTSVTVLNGSIKLDEPKFF
ncbi:unnamed protein product [Caenorhabditis angaria]|uniref:Uncharacterized protein n=1 Tax=Caenorhabditis angaria TaxID=860376 RepID=A0A9P1N2I9_9PELO|nr:unnamed protein product [Caenorhabditis angaria]